MSQVGIVVIGRNEGHRLGCCLKSLQASAIQIPVVYVDSGSVDDSCKVAAQLGVAVVELDRASPFTAARARNAGFQYLQNTYPDLEYVQFIDGDCELLPTWIPAATEVLEQQPDVVAVCGWRREQFPEQSLFNRICDVEWCMGDPGEVGHFGGDVMIRADALTAVGGYSHSVIAAEDDELSVRLRQAGGRIIRINQGCTLHDANMHTFGQWWRRAIRGGYAFAQVAHLHGAPPERKFVKEVSRTWLWGLVVPLSLVLLIPLTKGFSLLGLLRYPLSALKLTWTTRQQGWSWRHSFAWGVFCPLSAFPNALGAAQFHLDNLRQVQHQIIEYKVPVIDSSIPRNNAPKVNSPEG